MCLVSGCRLGCCFNIVHLSGETLIGVVVYLLMDLKLIHIGKPAPKASYNNNPLLETLTSQGLYQSCSKYHVALGTPINPVFGILGVLLNPFLESLGIPRYLWESLGVSGGSLFTILWTD